MAGYLDYSIGKMLFNFIVCFKCDNTQLQRLQMHVESEVGCLLTLKW